MITRKWASGLAYPLMIGGAIGLFLWIRSAGSALVAPPPAAGAAAAGAAASKSDVLLHVLLALIVLNIGLDLRILSPTLFAMLVLMAVITTLATTPILQMLTWRSTEAVPEPART